MLMLLILSVTFSCLNCYTDFIDIWHEHTLILEEDHWLLFTAIIKINADGALA